MIEKNAPVKFIKCYCGGWLKFVFQSSKIVYFGNREYVFKKPRWQLVNCFSTLKF